MGGHLEGLENLEGLERRGTEGELPFWASSSRSLVRVGAIARGQFELPSNTFRAIRDVLKFSRKNPIHR